MVGEETRLGVKATTTNHVSSDFRFHTDEGINVKHVIYSLRFN